MRMPVAASRGPLPLYSVNGIRLQPFCARKASKRCTRQSLLRGSPAVDNEQSRHCCSSFEDKEDCCSTRCSTESQRHGDWTRQVASAAAATCLGALFPLSSRAEQHSGLFAIADIDAKTAGSIATFLGPILSLSILLMICRIPLSWYPNLNVKRLPWIIAVAPTEPVLGPTRKAIPPVGGVDIAPIIWTAVLSFVNEILLGPQGILNLLQRKVDL